MIKNRIRPAALAGAVAVATGVSGLAVPAMAQDNAAVTNASTATQGLNILDGSLEVSVTPENVLEAELRDRTDAIAKYLGEDDENLISEIVADYVAEAEDGFDPSEGAAAILFTEAREDAGAQLAAASELRNDARASVAFALEADQRAETAWNNFVQAVTNAAGAINPLVDAVNDANSHEDFAILTQIDATNPVVGWNQLVDLQSVVKAQLDVAGEWDIDQEEGRSITRAHLIALEALEAELDGRIEQIAPIREEALQANRDAQRSDVLVRQLFLERVQAQLETLRIVEATFATAARYVELYENNELVNDTTLRTLYREVLGNLDEGLTRNLGQLREADRLADELYLDFQSDLENNHDGKAYDPAKLAFARQTYENIRENGRIWQEELERVQLIDQSIIDARQAEADRLEREREAAEEEAQRHQDWMDAIEDLLAEGNNNDDQNNDDDNGNNDDDQNNDEGSSVGNLGIFAVLAGVIGLIAAAFPFVSNFLNR